MAELADAAHLAAEHAGELTVQEYITHHLSFLTLGRTHDGHWGFAHTPEEAADMGFWAVNVDTLGWSIFLGTFFLWFFHENSTGSWAIGAPPLSTAIGSLLYFFY